MQLGGPCQSACIGTGSSECMEGTLSSELSNTEAGGQGKTGCEERGNSGGMGRLG